MSIQKLGASLISQTAEANIGLATLNVDFSIIKLQAPAEYKPLGNELTSSRRMAAEDGTPHVTARKLGALFQTWVPRTPDLIKAYGKRAVEIAQCREVNPKASKADGIFADHVGIDGTSIWAAATSGPHAIPVYLLACFLARMWSTTEATSIWVELVSERKRELAAVQETDPLFETSQLTSRISIPREDLAHWEASARSWLQAADRSMAKKQKQLMLILNNIELPVSTHPQLIENVLSSWKSAMIAIDCLVKGIPQSVENGAMLLGLSSWHLYPDMIVLGKAPSAIRIEQKDELISPAGLLTFGLNIKNPRHHGIYWSLSLSHLRYYGGPVMAERSLATQGNRITVPELFQVAVGSLIRSWGIDARSLASIMVELWNCIEGASHPHSAPGTSYWLGYISRAMEPLLDSDELARRQCTQLMQYGKNHCPKFLTWGEDIPSLFGILNLNSFLPLLINEEAGVEVLRSYAQSIDQKNERAFIIEYAVGSGNSQNYLLGTEYTTALPVQRSTLKRTSGGSAIQGTGHVRWVTTEFKKDTTGDSWAYDESRLSRFETQGESAFPVELLYLSRNRDERSITMNAPPSIFTEYAEESVYTWLHTGHNDDIGDIENSQVTFELVAGDPEHIALYATRSLTNCNSGPVAHSNHISLEILSNSVRKNLVNDYELVRYLNFFICHESKQRFLSGLRALATVENIYKMLPNSLITLGATSKPLYTVPWLPTHVPDGILLKDFRFSPFNLNIGETFACIAFFESGVVTVNPDSLHEVMAMATGDSIYIAGELLCDPTEMCSSYEVRRVWGSIGRPGIAMLIPPKEPQIREAGKDWRVVTHNAFDGRLEDSFQSSTLHLGFTDYVLPIDVGSHGNRDFEVYFLETVVSLHDHGTWVADLDILGQLDSMSLSILRDGCSHGNPADANQSVIGNPGFTMADNWDEILDCPGNASIVRSAGNWLGRLAAMALCLQLGRPTIVLPNRFCWECIFDAWQDMRPRHLKRHMARHSDASLNTSDPMAASVSCKHRPGSESSEHSGQIPDPLAMLQVDDLSNDTRTFVSAGDVTWDFEKGEWTFRTGETDSGEKSRKAGYTKEDMLRVDALEEMDNLVVIC